MTLLNIETANKTKCELCGIEINLDIAIVTDAGHYCRDSYLVDLGYIDHQPHLESNKIEIN